MDVNNVLEGLGVLVGLACIYLVFSAFNKPKTFSKEEVENSIKESIDSAIDKSMKETQQIVDAAQVSYEDYQKLSDTDKEIVGEQRGKEYAQGFFDDLESIFLEELSPDSLEYPINLAFTEEYGCPALLMSIIALGDGVIRSSTVNEVFEIWDSADAPLRTCPAILPYLGDSEIESMNSTFKSYVDLCLESRKQCGDEQFEEFVSKSVLEIFKNESIGIKEYKIRFKSTLSIIESRLTMNESQNSVIDIFNMVD